MPDDFIESIYKNPTDTFNLMSYSTLLHPVHPLFQNAVLDFIDRKVLV